MTRVASKQRYGSTKVYRQLMRLKVRCSRDRVVRLMRKNGLFSGRRDKFKMTTNSKHKHPIAQNILNREFNAAKPNVKWVSDFTYVWTREGEGWLYLAVVQVALRGPWICSAVGVGLWAGR